MSKRRLKKISLAVLIIAFFNVTLIAQTLSPEGVERAKQFDELYPVVMTKMDNGTLTLEDTDYRTCRKLLKKISSYDKYTTMKEPEMKVKAKAFKQLATTLRVGTAYLSSSKSGAKSTKFVAGKPMFLILKAGKSLLKESLEKNYEDGKSYLTIYFEQKGVKNYIKTFLTIPEEKLIGSELVTDLTFDLKNPDFKGIYNFLGKLNKGDNEVEFTLIRSNYSSTGGTSLKRVKIPIVITITDDRFANYAANADNLAYESITLGKPATSNPSLEAEMKTIYNKSFSSHKILKLIIEEDWYDLKDGGRLNYKKTNAYLAVTKNDGNCHRVYVGYVKENISTTGGVDLGPLKILTSAGPLRYTKMPCENVNK